MVEFEFSLTDFWPGMLTLMLNLRVEVDCRAPSHLSNDDELSNGDQLLEVEVEREESTRGRRTPAAAQPTLPTPDHSPTHTLTH